MIEINKKEDVVIPFDKIGEAGWIVKTKVIIESIAESFGDELKSPVADTEIVELETRLRTSLPDSLKLFYKTFGLADIGEQLQSFSEIGWINDIWKDSPEYGPEFTDSDKEYLPFLISFSDYLGNGNMFCFHSETKEIFYYDHDTQPYLTKIFDRVDDYLKGCLIFAQTDFYGDVDSEDVETWAEEIVSELFGNERVRIWRY